MCRLVGSTEPLRQSIFPLTDSSSPVKPTAGSNVRRSLLCPLLSNPLFKHSSTREHTAGTSVAPFACYRAHASPKYTLTRGREAAAVKVSMCAGPTASLANAFQSTLQPSLSLQSQKGS